MRSGLDDRPLWSRLPHTDGFFSLLCGYYIVRPMRDEMGVAGGVENLHKKGLSSTDKKDFFHGLLCQAMTQADLMPVEPLTVILSKKGWIRAAKGHEIDTVSLNYKDGDGYLEVAVTTREGLVFVWSGFVRSGLGFGGAVLSLPFRM